MNFCIENIGTTIVSSQVESDGHEAKNLLEKDPSHPTSSSIVYQNTKRKGFLADYFVRTPVTLSVKFPLCIEISHIVIYPKFGAQTSSAFTLETLTSYKVWKVGEETATSKFLVAKEFFNNTVIPKRIVFRNPRFVPRHPFALLSKSSEDSNGEIVFNLKHPSLNACERVIGLDVTILRSVGSSVPGLGGIEVWGQPCIRCPQESVQKLLVTWLRRTRKNNLNPSSPLSTPSFVPSVTNDDDDEDCSPTFVKRRKLSKNVTQEVSIPEEFLDSLTFEIMCQPIRLPCGINVDATTLQRFYKEEAIFGRPPSDPFTGNVYTQNVKPIADTALKIRIDQFLTKNAASSKNLSLQNLPRTVGTGSQGFSKAVCNDLGLTMASNNRPLIHNNFSISATSTSSNNSITIKTGMATVNPIPGKTKLSPTINKIQTETSSSSSPSSKMEDRLQQELAKIFGAGDDHLYLMKSATSTTTTTTTITTDQGMTKTCVQCRTNFENDFSTVIYSSTSCPHILICRKCVLTLPKQAHQKCATCDRDWNVQDLERIHSRS